jgi:hypothetical protein
MTLARKLARLETIVSARADAPTVSTFWTPARIEQWCSWVCRLLETMPEHRAVVAYVELTTLPADQWGPLTRHIETIATHATMGAWDAYIRQGRPVALPEAVCRILEAHPDARPRSAHDCEDCGFETPTLRFRPFLTTCPLCGGAVRWQGFNGRRWRALWERQKAEMAAIFGDGAA